MSTRSTRALVTDGNTTMHLYHEMHDDEAVHLSITFDNTNVELNLVVPNLLVPGVTAILRRAERPEE